MLTPQLPLWSDRDAAEGWLVRESARARRLTVRVFHTGRVEIVVPARTAPGTVERFIERHRGWIERKRDEARSRSAPETPFPPAAIELATCAERWTIEQEPGARALRLLTPEPGRLVLRGSPADQGRARDLLRRWLIAHARETLHPQLLGVAAEVGIGFERMLIRRQRTRWGSCSTRGTISLNCCLLFQPEAVTRYLLIHELVHRVHMNHSQRFWQRVARHCPDWEPLDRALLDGWRRVPAWVFGDGDGR